MSDQYPDDRDRILEQVKARSAWQTQTAVPTPPIDQGRPGSNQAIIIAVGLLGALFLLILLFSAGGSSPGGGGAVPSAATRLTQEAAAETVGRFILAMFVGDESTVEQHLAPSQLPLSSDARSQLEYARDGFAESGTSSTPTMGWNDGAYQVRVIDSYSESTLNCTPVFAGTESADVDVSLESEDGYSETIAFGLIAYAGSWRVDTADGEPVISLLSGE